MLVSTRVVDLLDYTPLFLLDCMLNYRVFVSLYNYMHDLLGSLSQLHRVIIGLGFHIQSVYETLVGG